MRKEMERRVREESEGAMSELIDAQSEARRKKEGKK
jgi:hypothetical protein